MTEREAELRKVYMAMLDYPEGKEDMRRFIDTHNLEEAEDYVDSTLGNVKRPLVFVRGKPISVNQMIQLVAEEEPLFREVSEAASEGEWHRDPRTQEGILNIFYRQCNAWIHPWVFSDGTIGGDAWSDVKYPELSDFLPDYMHLAERYPFLDMVVSYTTYREFTCLWCHVINDEWKENQEGYCKCKDCAPYLDRIKRYFHTTSDKADVSFEEGYFGDWDFIHVRSDVGDSVVVTIWIHNGRTDVLFGEEAAAKFNEYNHLYCAPEYAYMFSYMLYQTFDVCAFDKKFVEGCFEYLGKPRSLCDEYIKRKFIYFNEKDVAVTKEWVIKQYNTYIAGK